MVIFVHRFGLPPYVHDFDHSRMSYAKQREHVEPSLKLKHFIS